LKSYFLFRAADSFAPSVKNRPKHAEFPALPRAAKRAKRPAREVFAHAARFLRGGGRRALRSVLFRMAKKALHALPLSL